MSWSHLCFSLPFFSQLLVRPPQTAILLFCVSFSWRWSWFLPPVQCHEPPSIVLQALSLSELIPWIYLVTCSTSLKPASHSSCAFLPSFFSVLCVMFKYYFSLLFQLSIYVYGTVTCVLLSTFFSRILYLLWNNILLPSSYFCCLFLLSYICMWTAISYEIIVSLIFVMLQALTRALCFGW